MNGNHEERRSIPASTAPPPEERKFLHRAALFDTVAVMFVLALAAVWFAANVLLLVFACILFAILLFDLSCRVQKRLHLSRMPALSLVVVVLLGLLVAAGWLMAPQLAKQTGELTAAIPAAMQSVREALERNEFLRSLLQDLPSTDKIVSQLASMLPTAGLVFTGVLGALGNIAIIIFVGIYFAAQPHVYIEGIITLVPHRRRERVRQVLAEIGTTLGRWLVGKALAMVIVGSATGIGLALLGVPLALVLGVLAGLLDFIPYIGPIMAAVPAVLITLSDNQAQVVYVVLLFVAVQVMEGYLLLPLVEERSVSLPPALTIVMQVLLGALFGLAGVALATPLTAVLAVLVTMLYVQDVLGDEVRLPGEGKEG